MVSHALAMNCSEPDEVDAAVETAEIEPVGAHCRNPVGLADAVDEDDQRVLAYAQASGDLDGERAVAALVRASTSPSR